MGEFCCANNHGSLCSVCKSDINSIAVSRIWRETNDSGHCSIALSQLFSISNTKLSSLKPKREGRGRGEGGEREGGGRVSSVEEYTKLCACTEDHEMKLAAEPTESEGALPLLAQLLNKF